MPTLFTVVKAMLMPAIRRTQAATRASSTTVHLVSKRAVSVDTGDVGSRGIRPGASGQHSLESSTRNSGNFGLRAQRTQ